MDLPFYRQSNSNGCSGLASLYPYPESAFVGINWIIGGASFFKPNPLWGYLADRLDRKTLCLLSLLPILAGGLLLVVSNWNTSTQHVWIFMGLKLLVELGVLFSTRLPSARRGSCS